MMKRATLEPDLLDALRSSIEVGEVVRTAGQGRPNTVIAIEPEGVSIETERSEHRGTGPQLVPAWMIQAGFDELMRRGSLTQGHLQRDLNVKRSAAVCALLAQ